MSSNIFRIFILIANSRNWKSLFAAQLEHKSDEILLGKVSCSDNERNLRTHFYCMCHELPFVYFTHLCCSQFVADFFLMSKRKIFLSLFATQSNLTFFLYASTLHTRDVISIADSKQPNQIYFLYLLTIRRLSFRLHLRLISHEFRE